MANAHSTLSQQFFLSYNNNNEMNQHYATLWKTKLYSGKGSLEILTVASGKKCANLNGKIKTVMKNAFARENLIINSSVKM